MFFFPGEVVILHVRDLWFILIAGKVIVRTNLLGVVDIKGERSFCVEFEFLMSNPSSMKTFRGVGNRENISMSLVYRFVNPLQVSHVDGISSIHRLVWKTPSIEG